MTYFSLQVEGTVLNAHILNGRIINLGILCSGNTTQTRHCLLFKFQGTMKCKCDFNKHSQSNVIECFWTLSFFSLLKLSSLCCYVFIFFNWYLYLYLYFLHLFYITGHLYYITDLKILFLRFKYRITRMEKGKI